MALAHSTKSPAHRSRKVLDESTIASQPPINFATTTGNPTLAQLIHNLAITKAANDAALDVHLALEEKHRRADGSLTRIQRPQVCGGKTQPMALIKGDERTEFEAGDWYYSDRDAIEKHGANDLAKAADDAERASIKARVADHLAEWDRQEKLLAQAYPKELRAAERAADRTQNLWIAAERELTRYKPTNSAEAVELLTLAGKLERKGELFLIVEGWQLQSIVRNCAEALRKELNE